MRRNDDWNDRDFRGSDFERGGVGNRDLRDRRTHSDQHDDPDAIEANIRRTRGHMDDTLDELIRRLEPGRLLGDIWHSVRSHAGSAGDGAANLAGSAARNAGTGIARQVARHPLPSAVIGAGIAWLIAEQARGGSKPKRDDDWDDQGAAWGRYRGGPMDRSEERLRGYSGYNPGYAPGSAAGYNPGYAPAHEEHDAGRDEGGGVMRRAGDVGRRAAHTVGDAAERAGHSVADAGRRVASAAEHAAERGIHTVSSAAREVGDRASTGVHVASRRVSRTANHAARNIADTASDTYERYPLGVALAAMGAGILAGMAVPNTRRENRLMGDTSRRLRRDAIGTAREHAADAIETGSERVAQAAETAAERAEKAVRGEKQGEGRHDGEDRDSGSARGVEYGAAQAGKQQSGAASQVEPRH